MLIYRFKVTCEESDGFLREIEIQPNQTFLDFHHILVDSSELLRCEKASFYITDKKYKKDREISLKSAKKQIRKYDEDNDQVVTELVPVPLMKTEKLKNYIEDPHQKMIYEFVGREDFSFHLELFKIFQSEGTISFPRCIKHIGELPKKAEQPVPVPEKPIDPKIVIPKIALPAINNIAKLEHLVENEDELAAIESELGGLLAEAATSSNGDQELGVSADYDYSFGQNDEDQEDEHIDHLDDFDDLESLDRRMSGFDHDSDDF
ncbi:MAG: hypothetical protein NT004_16740 [Bacteroidetes bacterium]|nr:hypothetical protein [Bacteroidota bacterium]